MHKQRRGLTRHLLQALLLLAIALCPTQLPAQESDIPAAGEGSRFTRTAAYLQSADGQLRANFASTALESLAQAYALEAEQARQKGLADEENQELLAWSMAVERYAANLRLLLEDIELGFPVILVRDEKGPLGIRVADLTVILSHPRLDQQGLFEQQVLVDFCSRHRCDQFASPQGDAKPIPLSAGRVRPAWAFTDDGALCSYRGVHVRFGPGADLAASRSTCEQFMFELMTLAHELAWQRRHGVDADWTRMTIAPVRGRPMHQVRLNDRGDILLVPLPILGSSPGLLAAVRPWIEAHVDGDEPVPLELRASHYGWERAGD